MAILHGIKIMEYTEGKVVLNNPPSLWQDELILGRFLSAILATVLPQVMVCKSSHEVWSTLLLVQWSQVLTLRQKLQKVEKNFMSITQFLSKKKKLDELAIVK